MSHYDLPVLLPLAALCLIIYVLAAVFGSRRGYRHGKMEFRKEYATLQEENQRLEVQDSLRLCYTDGLEQEIERLQEEIHTLDSDV